MTLQTHQVVVKTFWKGLYNLGQLTGRLPEESTSPCIDFLTLLIDYPWEGATADKVQMTDDMSTTLERASER